MLQSPPSARRRPKLQSVEFSTLGSSLGPAESFSRVFPQLQSLRMAPWGRATIPADAHRRTSRSGTRSERRGAGPMCCIRMSTEFVAAIVGTPVGDRITQFVVVMVTRELQTEARSRPFPNLTELCTTCSPVRLHGRTQRSRGNFESIFIAAYGSS